MRFACFLMVVFPERLENRAPFVGFCVRVLAAMARRGRDRNNSRPRAPSSCSTSEASRVPRGALHARQSDKQCWCFYFIGQCGNITDLQKRASEITAQKRACLREREEGRTLDAPNADEAKTNDASCTAPAVRASRCVVRITDTSVTNAMASPERSA